MPRLEKFLTNEFYVGGPALQKFEANFAKYVRAPFCVGTGNGYDALVLALKALNIGKGDEVLVPAQTFIATWLAVTAVGAKPVPVEIDKKTYGVDPTLIAHNITARTKAIIVVHLFGVPADILGIKRECSLHNLLLLEDTAQAHGATISDAPIGSHGNICCWSFYPGKNLGAFGDGGGVTSFDPDINNKIKQLSNYGSSSKYHHSLVGLNSRLDPIQALMLDFKLEFLNDDIMRRREIAQRYIENINHRLLQLPCKKLLESSSFHIFPLLVYDHRAELKRYLLTKGVETVVHYPLTPYLQECYEDLNIKLGSFPVAESLSQQELSLPISPFLKDDQIDFVIEKLNEWYP